MSNFAQKMIILSAPSGCGKTTLARSLLASVPVLSFSISACTRKPRAGEEKGSAYYFTTPEAFRQKVKEKAFLEWEEVYEGQFYGTLHSELQRLAVMKKHILFDVDVKGGQRIKQEIGHHAFSIFVRPPSLEILAQRLRDRGTEDEAGLRRRLDRAREELRAAPHFDYQLVNDKQQQATEVLTEKVLHFLAT